MGVFGAQLPRNSQTSGAASLAGCGNRAPGATGGFAHSSGAQYTTEARATGAGQECWLELTVHSAESLKNTKLLRRMSPCAVVSVNGTSLTQASAVAVNGGTNPVWNERFVFFIPDAILRSENPKPLVTVEIFSTSRLKKSLGTVCIPLTVAISRYNECCSFKQGILYKGRFCGTLSYSMVSARPTFAPNKGTPEYDSFVQWLQAPPAALSGARKWPPATPQGSHTQNHFYSNCAGAGHYPTSGYPRYAAQPWCHPGGYPAQQYPVHQGDSSSVPQVVYEGRSRQRAAQGTAMATGVLCGLVFLSGLLLF